MNHPDFTRLRRSIDKAITFNEVEQAKDLALEGLKLADKMKVKGERMFFQAQLEIISGNFEEAIIYLDKAIKHNPTDGAAYNDKALCLLELGIMEGVGECFDEGISVEPDYATIYHNKGWFLQNLGQYQEALALFHKALELEPDRAVTYENIADVYKKLGKNNEAVTAYKKALSLIEPSFEDIRKQIQSQIDSLAGDDRLFY